TVGHGRGRARHRPGPGRARAGPQPAAGAVCRCAAAAATGRGRQPPGRLSMCGIAGLVTAPGQPAPDPALGRRMNAAIVHRGPDDEGLYHDARALLGMRRLSIIDVAGGHQPMLAAEGQVCIVFNGEIYNYRELRAGLERDGHGFASHSDTEVILQGYLRDGVAIFDRLDGMFAVAIWDRRTGEL